MLQDEILGTLNAGKFRQMYYAEWEACSSVVKGIMERSPEPSTNYEVKKNYQITILNDYASSVFNGESYLGQYAFDAGLKGANFLGKLMVNEKFHTWAGYIHLMGHRT